MRCRARLETVHSLAIAEWTHARPPPRPSATSNRSSRCSRAYCRHAASCSRSAAAPGSTWRTSPRLCPPSLSSPADVERHASIEAWAAAGNLSNVKPPLAIDVTKRPWPVSAADAVVCINVIHTSPWEATLALMAGASGILPVGGVLVTYGPYMRGGAHTSQSNEAFDASLRARGRPRRSCNSSDRPQRRSTILRIAKAPARSRR
jgi:hypothetical protein